MMEKFDPTMQEHIRCVKVGEIHDHYLQHNIENELIQMLALEIKKLIVIDRLRYATKLGLK